MTKRWERLNGLKDIQQAGLVDTPLRTYDPNEQEKIYERLTTNVSILRLLNDVVNDLRAWGYTVRVLSNSPDEISDNPYNVGVTFPGNLDGRKEVRILIPCAYLTAATLQGSDIGKPNVDERGFVMETDLDVSKLLQYAIAALQIADEHREWLNEEV